MKKIRIISFIGAVLMALALSACDNNAQQKSNSANDENVIAKSNSANEDNTQTNNSTRYNIADYDYAITYIANGEYATVYNGRIYFSFSSGLRSMNTDGSDLQMLSEVFARHMQIEDDRIYFKNWNYRGYIFCMNIDGTGLLQLNEESVNGLAVVDGWIYYSISSSNNNSGSSGMGIYKMRTDGSERQLLTDDKVSSFVIVDDVIYYRASSDYFRMGIDGNDRQQLIDDSALIKWSATTIGERFYYTDMESGKIYSKSIDGSDHRELTEDDGVGQIVLIEGSSHAWSGETIYYCVVFLFEK